MKIVNIIGGLGNQMFQYAFALKINHLFPEEQIKIYTGAFKGYPLHNGYELSKIFKIFLPEASLLEVTKNYWPVFNYNIYRLCRHWFPNRKGFKDSYFHPIRLNEIEQYSFFDGYFQRASLYKDISQEIIEAFKFPELLDSKNKVVVDFISKGITASIHVRRGDYLTDKNYGGICNIDYYKKAIHILKKNTDTKQVLVFSNDVEWSKKNLSNDLLDLDVLFVDWNTKSDSYKDMQLMSMCNHNVIANSSFSWWGAFLNKNLNKVVIAPNKWAHSYQDAPILLENWIKVVI